MKQNSSFPDSSGLLHLPTEVILYILEAVDSLSDLRCLILTAPQFNHVWRAHTTSISSAVLSRKIDCFAEASTLEESVHSELPVGFGPALERHKRIISAACLASTAYELFREDYNPTLYYQFVVHWHDEDRQSFKRCFYWVWVAVVTSTYKPFRLQKPLCPFPLPREDTLALCELIVWVRAGTYTVVSPLLSRTYGLYHHSDRVRCAQSRRWQVCCRDIWQKPEFEKVRAAYWSDLDMVGQEPQDSFAEENEWWNRPPTAVLGRARAMNQRRRRQNLQAVRSVTETE